MAALLIGAALACNMPVNEDATTETPETSPTVEQPAGASTRPVQATLGSPQTVPSSIQTQESEDENGGPAPTFTPIQQPTLASSLTPSVTPSRRPTNTPRPTSLATVVQSGGPLNFDHRITWRLKDASAKIAIATVTINVTGGSGVYSFYRDDLPVAGPVFEYEWATCRGNPGSLRVDSSDGQTKRIDYFETPPCPTPTPTP